MQNPNYQYSDPRRDWVEGHYHGIASILNNLTYSQNGKLVDPLDSKLINDYYWLPGRNLIEYSETLPYVMVPDTLQLQPYNLFDNLPPFLDSESGVAACMASLEAGSTSGCESLTWENLTSHRVPGVWLFPDSSTGPLSFTIPATAYTFEGVELYYNNSLVFQNLTPSGGGYTLYTGGQAGANYSIRLLGASSIWDIPSAQISPSIPFTVDSLYSSCALGPFAHPYYPLVTPQGIFWGTLTTTESNFPHLNTTFSLYQVTITVTSSTGEAVWTNGLYDDIINNNNYPTNYPLLERQGNYTTNAVNLSSAEDQEYLYRIWATHLARRRPTTSTDCLTPDLSTIVYNSSLPSRIWTMAQTTYDLPPGADEGGCRPDPFWDGLTGCATCLPGLGPITGNCSLPFRPNPQPGEPEAVCAGHGTAIQSDFDTAAAPQYEYYIEGDWVFPVCDSITYLGNTYTLINQGQGVVYIYVYGNQYIAWEGSTTLYINGAPTAFLQIQSPPYTPIYQVNPFTEEAASLYCNGPLSTQYLLRDPPGVFNHYLLYQL